MEQATAKFDRHGGLTNTSMHGEYIEWWTPCSALRQQFAIHQKLGDSLTPQSLLPEMRLRKGMELAVLLAHFSR